LPIATRDSSDTVTVSYPVTDFKFFQFLREDRPELSEGAIGPRGFALLMIAIGLTALLLATLEHLCIDHLGSAERTRMEYPGPWLPEPLAEPNQESVELASSLTTAFLVLLEQLAPTERAVFLLREVFELDFDEIARSVGKSEANTRQILTRARGRLRDSRPRFTVSRRESEEIVRRFRHATVTGNVEALMAVLHADAKLVADGGGKAAAATRPVLGADRITRFMLGYAGKVHWSESDFQLVMINGAPGLLLRHPISGNGTYSFDIADGRIRAIYVVRNPDKLRGFLEHTQSVGVKTS
jgi:RNA polymerase sigma-70 factor, ECF subfamily